MIFLATEKTEKNNREKKQKIQHTNERRRTAVDRTPYLYCLSPCTCAGDVAHTLL
jgi:hypothetical protein